MKEEIHTQQEVPYSSENWQYYRDFARGIGMNPDVVRRKCQNGEIPAKQLFGNRWYVDLVAVQQNARKGA